MFLANSIHPLLFIVIILAFFGLIALVVFILRKHLPSLRDDGEKPATKEEAAKEALDRILVPIEDNDENKEKKDSKENNEKSE
mgnify:CR=1 FL=1